MLVRQLKNISTNPVNIILENGNSINLPPNGILENVRVLDLSGVLKFLSVRYPLNG
jgi:hypothetical protein